MDENQETVAAEEQELETGAEDATEETEGQEAETEGAAETQPEKKDEEETAPKVPENPYKQKFAAMKGDKVLIARMAKNMMDDLGLSYEDAAKYAGITPEDLKARIEKDEGADPVMAQANAFDALYLKGGVKESLDEVYGENTQRFVDAFVQYGLTDEELTEEYLNLEPSKLPAFVVKHGKQLLEDVGEVKGSPAKIIKAKNARIKELEDQLAAAKGANSEDESNAEEAKPNGKRPLSGAVDSVPGKNTVRAGGSLYDSL